MSKEKTCFVIAPIGTADSEDRKRSDSILKHIIKPAAVQCGFKALRADEIDEPGIITSQVIQHVVDDELVVADLTGRNPNVFYELAIRHAIKRPLVQLIEKGETIPFDVAATRTIQVDHRDLDSAAEAKAQIVEQIRAATNGTYEIDTPISVALDLQQLRRSGKPEERSLAELMNAISALRSDMSSIKERMAHGFARTVGDVQSLRRDSVLKSNMAKMANDVAAIAAMLELLASKKPNAAQVELMMDARLRLERLHSSLVGIELNP